MRPVNLIPAEQRRGDQAALRTGPLAYMLLGALVLALAGVTALVLTENQISDRKSEVVALRREDAVAQAQAKRLAAYAQFRALSEQRVATVTSLADSRFDWERVMRELALILPSDVWLSGLQATATPGVSLGGGEGGGSSASLRGAVPGPALELNGCATGQDAVASFVTALKDIDGVTRVGVATSELAKEGEGAGSGNDGGSDCRTRESIAQFSLVIAFDAAPVPPEEGEAGATSATETAETTSSESPESSEESSGEGSEG